MKFFSTKVKQKFLEIARKNGLVSPKTGIKRLFKTVDLDQLFDSKESKEYMKSFDIKPSGWWKMFLAEKYDMFFYAEYKKNNKIFKRKDYIPTVMGYEFYNRFPCRQWSKKRHLIEGTELEEFDVICSVIGNSIFYHLLPKDKEQVISWMHEGASLKNPSLPFIIFRYEEYLNDLSYKWYKRFLDRIYNLMINNQYKEI